jgi:hypothetical protein
LPSSTKAVAAGAAGAGVVAAGTGAVAAGAVVLLAVGAGAATVAAAGMLAAVLLAAAAVVAATGALSAPPSDALQAASSSMLSNIGTRFSMTLPQLGAALAASVPCRPSM